MNSPFLLWNIYVITGMPVLFYTSILIFQCNYIPHIPISQHVKKRPQKNLRTLNNYLYCQMKSGLTGRSP